VAAIASHCACFQAQECLLLSCWISSNILMSVFQNMRDSQKVMPLTFLFNITFTSYTFEKYSIHSHSMLKVWLFFSV
jgi:hypothetical protein